MQSEAQVQSPPRRVLVVEDTSDIRELLSEILTDEGYSVVTVSNGAEALEALKRDSFGLVLLDLMMPIMNGFELLTRLQTGGNKHPPVVAMSAFERFRREAHDLGAESFLSKPVDIDRLLQEVQRVIELETRQGGKARASLLTPESAPADVTDTDKVLRQLEAWIEVERATYRPSEFMRSAPRTSMLVLGDASAEEDMPGGMYARLVVQRGPMVVGFLELADSRIRDLLGEELSLIQFVADWIGAGKARLPIETHAWGARLTELVVATVIEKARREGRPLLLASIRGEPSQDAARLSALQTTCQHAAFLGLRAPGEIIVAGNGQAMEQTLAQVADTLLRPSIDVLKGAAIGVLSVAPGEIPNFSEALFAVRAESLRLQQGTGHGVSRIALPGAETPSPPLPHLSRH